MFRSSIEGTFTIGILELYLAVHAILKSQFHAPLELSTARSVELIMVQGTTASLCIIKCTTHANTRWTRVGPSLLWRKRLELPYAGCMWFLRSSIELLLEYSKRAMFYLSYEKRVLAMSSSKKVAYRVRMGYRMASRQMVDKCTLGLQGCKVGIDHILDQGALSMLLFAEGITLENIGVIQARSTSTI
jgi:hypothetical protein